MKSLIKVSQWSLRGKLLNRQLNLKIDNNLTIEATPKSEYILSLSNKRERLRRTGWSSFRRIFLPDGYPQTVHGTYLKFTAWTAVQGVASSVVGVLSTQVMLGSLINDNQASLNSGAASATINWILKDGLGQAGGILLVSLLGSRLDRNARSLRFYSTLLLILGSFLEFMVPLGGRDIFLPMAAGANVLKNVSWIMASATRAHFMKHLALKDNLGDLTGKAGSQMTFVSLFGTGIGLLSLKYWLQSSFWIWLSSALVTLISSYFSCRVAVSRQLSINNISQILSTLSMSTKISSETVLSRYILTPEIIATKENILFPQSRKSKVNDFKFVYNPELTILLGKQNLSWPVPMDKLNENNFCIACDSSEKFIFIWTNDKVSSKERLLSVLEANKIALGIENIASIDLFEGLKKQGWDVDQFYCPELEDPDGYLYSKE